MYVPEAFRESNEAILQDVMALNPFATVVSNGEITPEISLLPLIFEPESREIVGHFAKANPHWKAFSEGGSATAIFHGPHAYVSPLWYETRPNVPTWAYVTVMATGTVRLLTAEEAVEDLLTIVERFDPSLKDQLPESVDRAMVTHKAGGVVAFRMKVEELVGKFTVGQNKHVFDRIAAANALEEAGQTEMATLYRQALPQ